MKLALGDFTLHSVPEVNFAVRPQDLFRDAEAPKVEAQRGWLTPHFMNGAGAFLMAVQMHVLRTGHHTIVVDTCFGNHKKREYPGGNMLNTPLLSRLKASGVAPEEVDYVFCSHLHSDHVGWNTKLENGRWVPTFPKAKYLFGRQEWDFWKQVKPDAWGYEPIEDSVLPVIASGQAVFVDSGFSIEEGIVVEPSPGHTPGHASLHLASRGREAMMTGDLLHHPIQCSEPSWETTVTMDPKVCQASRRVCLDRLADTDTVLLGAHFDAPTACRVVRHGNAWRLKI